VRRSFPLLIVLALAATACSVEFGGGRNGSDSGLRSQPLPESDEPVAVVVERVLPAVVNVTTDVFRTDALGNPSTARGVGTGFIVRPNGVIVTNCHVIEGASRITVSTSDEEPARHEARVIGGDCENDLAVLQVDARGLPTVPLGDSDQLVLGQQVVAIGYALALEGGPSVTTGILSSLDRTIRARDPNCTTCGPDDLRTYPSVLQTDAAINQGNSGGPLVDMQGRVIGINSAGNDGAENIGFAIPVDAAKDPISLAIDEPLAPSAYLGVSTRPVTADLALQLDLTVDSGAYVLATTGDGPAEEAGIRQGDVIVAVAGEEVTSSEQLGVVLDGQTPGERVPVEVVREDGSSAEIEVTLGTRPLPTVLP
jgi:serine protease Do